MTTASRGVPARLLGHYPTRIAAYYAALFTGGAFAWPYLPPMRPPALAGTLDAVGRLGDTSAVSFGGAVLPSSAIETVLAAAGALLLSLPVAWVYMFTRPRKGYRQSVVHTLVLMPVVVAGIVVLVKNSLALAFGLAAIVGAIRFRNTLDDSRDTIFVLGALGLGLASAVQLEVAVVMSLVFNLIVLVLFYTDFARTPPALEGVRARRHMERALETANRTSQFVAVMDDSVLRSMAPAQLDAMAERIRKRREGAGSDAPMLLADRYPTTVRIITADLAALRDALEPVLESGTKRWLFAGASPDPAGTLAEYTVKVPKGLSALSLADLVRTGGGAHVVDVFIA